MSEGPDRNWLLRMRGMLPSLAQGMVERRTVGKGKPVAAKHPRKKCNLCGCSFDFELLANPPLVTKEPCASCASQLADGCIGVVSEDDYAIIKFKDGEILKDMVGKVMHVQPHTMVVLAEKYAAVIKKREENGHESSGAA